MQAVESLSRFPERGGYPKELSTLAIHEYRQKLKKYNSGMVSCQNNLIQTTASGIPGVVYTPDLIAM
jgi:hypothetical protein